MPRPDCLKRHRRKSRNRRCFRCVSPNSFQNVPALRMPMSPPILRHLMSIWLVVDPWILTPAFAWARGSGFPTPCPAVRLSCLAQPPLSETHLRQLGYHVDQLAQGPTDRVTRLGECRVALRSRSLHLRRWESALAQPAFSGLLMSLVVPPSSHAASSLSPFYSLVKS